MSTSTPTLLLPGDPNDRELRENTHPPDWNNPVPQSRYDLVVIGGGTAGLVSAGGAGLLGAKVALVERSLMGGDCLVTGCVPSKALLRAARAAADARGAQRFGVRCGRVEVDFTAAMERMRRARARISRHDAAQRFADEYGVDVFLGNARFTARDAVDVDGTPLRFARAVIATGARATVPSIPGLADSGFRTNENIFNLTERPRRLAVIGGGPLGCEMAQAFARLGSEVTIVDRGPRFLHREDPDAAGLLYRVFVRDGITVRLNTSVERIDTRHGTKLLHVRRDGEASVIEADEILVGVGRTPNADELDLEAAGVGHDRQSVKTDDFLRTSNRRVFACGDVCLRHKFTHMADATARLVVQNALLFPMKRLSRLVVPWVTYTDPEIAHVGLYEREASDQGVAVQTYRVGLDDVDRAVTDDETEGFLKLHVKKGGDRIVGATIVGTRAGEMISEVTTAIVNRVGLKGLVDVIHPYPTQAEAIRKAADEHQRSRFTPGLKRLLSFWLALRR